MRTKMMLPTILLLFLTSCSKEPVTVTPPGGETPTTITATAAGSPKEIIHLSDPDGDFAASWSRHDSHFIGIMGVGLTIPGIPSDDWSEVQIKYGVKTIDGISDAVDARSAAIGATAHDYAVKYNTQLLKKLDIH